ncbi:hypothetical protein ACLOJK_023589 [Asimina triloba]
MADVSPELLRPDEFTILKLYWLDACSLLGRDKSRAFISMLDDGEGKIPGRVPSADL